MAPLTTATTTHAEGGGADGYDRRRPLFEGTLPVELISPAAAGAHAATGASNREEQPLTIRVLRGTRAQAGGGGGERVLRLEVCGGGSVPLFVWVSVPEWLSVGCCWFPRAIVGGWTRLTSLNETNR